MKRNPVVHVPNESGISIVEVLVSIVILTVVASGLASFSLVADRQLKQGRQDDRMHSAVQQQFEELTSAGYGSLASDSSKVLGFKMKWVVQGTDPAPKRVLLMVESEDWSGATVTDTFVTSIAKGGS